MCPIYCVGGRSASELQFFFLIENDQLFIGTAQFSIGTAQFFIGTAQFFIGTAQFFIGTAQFFIGTAQFFIGTAQFFIETAQFLVAEDSLFLTHSMNCPGSSSSTALPRDARLTLVTSLMPPGGRN